MYAPTECKGVFLSEIAWGCITSFSIYTHKKQWGAKIPVGCCTLNNRHSEKNTGELTITSGTKDPFWEKWIRPVWNCSTF